MSSQPDQPTEQQQAMTTIGQLVFGQMAAQVVAAAGTFRIADIFGDQRRGPAEVAGSCAADPASMRRLLRALAALGLLVEREPDSFELTAAGAMLRTDRDDSMHGFAAMFTDPTMMAAWQRLDESVRTGETMFDKVFGTDFFSHLKTQPELSARFNTAMRQGTYGTAAILPGNYDFGRFQTIVDVGGGDGTLLAAILAEHSALRGMVFDTEEGGAQAAQTFRERGIAERAQVRVGDFFATVPEGGDLYLMKSIIHDWDDQRCRQILGHIRAVLPAHGRLLIIEPVLPPVVGEPARPITYLSDLNMLVNVGGKERTGAEFEQLCQAAGFAVRTLTPLPAPSGFHLIEATPG